VLVWKSYGEPGLIWSNLEKNRQVEQKPKEIAAVAVALKVP